MISVLIPSKYRERELREAVESCIRMADDPGRLEFVFLVDAGDSRTRDSMRALHGWWEGMRYMVVEQNFLRGYQDIHEMYNIMGGASSGGWLWVFADDCYVRTQGWDSMVEAEGDGSGLSVIQMEMNGHPWCQPIISRGLFNLLGWFAPHFSLDAWLHMLAVNCGIEKTLPFRIDHLRFGVDRGWDEVRRLRDDCLMKIEEDPDWHVLEDKWKELRKVDEEKVRRALNVS